MKAARRSSVLHPARRGLSLLEVILASAIFVASIAVIGNLLDVGMLIVQRGDRETIGQLRAESKMEEIVAGIQPFETQSTKSEDFEPYEDDPHWSWKVTSVPTPMAGLLRVTVEVGYMDDPEATSEAPDNVWSFTRLVTDPALLRPSKEEIVEPTGTITVPEMLGIGSPAPGGPAK